MRTVASRVACVPKLPSSKYRHFHRTMRCRIGQGTFAVSAAAANRNCADTGSGDLGSRLRVQKSERHRGALHRAEVHVYLETPQNPRTRTKVRTT